MDVSLGDTPKICRTCLVEITEDSDIFCLSSLHSNNTVITLKHKLKTCVKDLNLKITPNAVICGDCYISVNFIYKFRKKCLQTEEYINSYLQGITPGSSRGNLLQVVQQTKENSSKHFDCNIIKLECNDSDQISGVQDLAMVDLSKISFNCLEENSINSTEAENGTMECIQSTSEIVATELQNFKPLYLDRTNAFNCSYCSYSINHKPALSRHIHSKHSTEVIVDKLQKKYRCPACTFTFKTKRVLNFNSFKCKNCKYISTNVIGLERMKSGKKHHKSDKNPCKCTKCNYKAATKRLLKSHSTDAYKRFQILACKLLEEAYDAIN